ncbi:MAG TPA: hypothetical protein VM123_17815 [archaeon]|nr:hypothetical protein [archaeon]
MKSVITCFIVPAVLGIIMISACVKSEYVPYGDLKETFAPTDSVLVYRDYPDQPYVIIGIVTATGINQGKLFSRLKKEAMSVGANAIIMKRMQELTQEYASERRSEFSTRKLRLEAVAIRFKDSK